MRTANFAENKVRVMFEKWPLNVRCIHCQQSDSDRRRKVKYRVRITAKVNVCWVEKRSTQKVRDIRRALNRAILNNTLRR